MSRRYENIPDILTSIGFVNAVFRKTSMEQKRLPKPGIGNKISGIEEKNGRLFMKVNLLK